MTAYEPMDITALREAVAAMTGSLRLYLHGDIEAIRPLIEPFSLDDMWTAFGYLASTCASLDGDNSATAARLRNTGAKLRELNPNPDPVMSGALLDVATSLEATTVNDDATIDLPDLQGKSQLLPNAYPFMMAYCLALSIEHLRWADRTKSHAESIEEILEHVTTRVSDVLDHAEIMEQEQALAPFVNTRDETWIREVEFLTIHLVQESSPSNATKIESVFVGKDPIDVGPYLMESLTILASATSKQPGTDALVSRLHDMARAATLNTPTGDIAKAVDVLCETLAAITVHPVRDGQLFAPLGVFDKGTTTREVLGATRHVIDTLVITLSTPESMDSIREYLTESVRIAAETARSNL